jgi:hypothetical protein
MKAFTLLTSARDIQSSSAISMSQILRACMAASLEPRSEISSVNHGLPALEINTAEGALKVAIHRLRKRYRELFRQEIADTVADPAEVESELRFWLPC